MKPLSRWKADCYYWQRSFRGRKDGVNVVFYGEWSRKCRGKIIAIQKSVKNGVESKKLANKFMERSQAEKLEKLYENLIKARENQ